MFSSPDRQNKELPEVKHTVIIIQLQDTLHQHWTPDAVTDTSPPPAPGIWIVLVPLPKEIPTCLLPLCTN